MNWGLINNELTKATITDETNRRAIIATVLIETAHTFAPIQEFGSNDYFVKHYWENERTRKQLGNIIREDAVDYSGKGFIQLTGRHNYEKMGKALNLPLLSQPRLMLQAEPSARACVNYWVTHGIDVTCHNLNLVRDAGPRREALWQEVRRRVNGGLNGWDVFKKHLQDLEIW